MAVLITSNMTEIHDCDATTGWSSGGTNSVDNLEGSGCLADQVKSTTSAVILYTMASAVNLTSKFVVMTMKVNGVVDTQALGGYRVYMEDSSARRGTWYVGGKDTHPGGWNYFAVDPSTTGFSKDSGFDITDILKVGVGCKTLTSVIGTADNFFWDICHYGTGLTITSAASESGGSGTGGATGWEDIYDYDTGTVNPHYYGIVSKINGVYFVRGKLIFGDNSTLSIDFEDSALIGFLPGAYMTDTVTGLTALGNATGSSNIIMSDSVIFSNTRKPTYAVSDTDIDTFTLPSTTIQIAAVSNFSAGEFIGTAFDSCEQLTFGSAVFTDGVIRNSVSTSAALLYPTGTDNLERINFKSAGTGHAILIDTTGTYTFDGHTFDGYASTDGSTGNECVYNNSGGAVTINIINGGDTPTYRNGTSASTTVVNSVNLTVTVKDKDNVAIENAQVAIYKTSDDTQLMNEDTLATGIATEAFAFTTDTDIYYRVRKSSTGTTRYIPVQGVGEITSAGFAVTVIMYEDINIL